MSKVISASEHTTSEYAETVKLAGRLNETRLFVIELIVQKDIDKLEKQVEALTKSRQSFKVELKNCNHSNGEVSQQYERYDKKLDIVLNEKILVGKSAEATDYFIAVLSPEFSKISAEFDANQIELRNKLTKSLEESKVTQS